MPRDGTGLEKKLLYLFCFSRWSGVLFVIEVNDKDANIAAVTVKGEAITLKRN